jgi:hypothetical protein
MGKLFKGPKVKAPAPPPPPPPPVPIANEEEIKKAKRRQLLKRTKAGGRASTILSEGSDETLGG